MTDRVIDLQTSGHYVGDCRELMRHLPDACAQACITSPPYWGLRDYGHPGQIGLEATPELYVAELVKVFREVRRVLRDDGTLWLNLGDCYASGPSGPVRSSGLNGSQSSQAAFREATAHKLIPPGLKPKDLVGIPWLTAFALRADGWWLRQDVIWSKPNPMPESVTDRCTKAHEYVFLLSKSADYYYDDDAIAEPAVQAGRVLDYTGNQKANAVDPDLQRTLPKGRKIRIKETRNKRSVWTVASQPYHGAHFATFPPKLIEPCILAGSRPGDLVLDPFFGTGTTGAVAEKHGRRWIGFDLGYAQLAKERTAQRSLVLGVAP